MAGQRIGAGLVTVLSTADAAAANAAQLTSIMLRQAGNASEISDQLGGAEKYKKAKVKSFSHRGVAPVYANDDLIINIENKPDDRVNCFTSTKDEGMTMKAEAIF